VTIGCQSKLTNGKWKDLVEDQADHGEYDLRQMVLNWKYVAAAEAEVRQRRYQGVTRCITHRVSIEVKVEVKVKPNNHHSTGTL